MHCISAFVPCCIDQVRKGWRIPCSCCTRRRLKIRFAHYSALMRCPAALQGLLCIRRRNASPFFHRTRRPSRSLPFLFAAVRSFPQSWRSTPRPQCSVSLVTSARGIANSALCHAEAEATQQSGGKGRGGKGKGRLGSVFPSVLDYAASVATTALESLAVPAHDV